MGHRVRAFYDVFHFPFSPAAERENMWFTTQELFNAKRLDKQTSEGSTFDYFNKPSSCMFETLPVCVSCRHTSADADSRPQRTCGPSASIRLRLPGACRIQSASSSARLRLWHVKTLAPFSPHAGWSYHPSISHSPSPDHYCLCMPSTGSWG